MSKQNSGFPQKEISKHSAVKSKRRVKKKFEVWHTYKSFLGRKWKQKVSYKKGCYETLEQAEQAVKQMSKGWRNFGRFDIKEKT